MAMDARFHRIDVELRRSKRDGFQTRGTSGKPRGSRALGPGDPGRFEHLNEAEDIFEQLRTPYELELVRGAKRGK